jgi:hypothetical protein
MEKKKPKILDFPNFPMLQWDEFFWRTTIQLAAWDGYQDRSGSYGSKRTSKKSDGLVQLTINVLSDEERSNPTLAQSAAYTHLLKNQKQIQKAILLAIFERYPEYRASYLADYDLDETDDRLPILKRHQQLKDLVGLSGVFVHTVEKDGIAYVGYEFGCDWEEEHGLGAMMHMDRVVEIGDAAVGILEWIADRDAKPPKKKKQSAPKGRTKR